MSSQSFPVTLFHFLLRDFKSHRLSWILLVAVSLLYFPLKALEFDALGPIGYFYLLFPMVTLQQIAGVNWRSQHIMSRNYLLALPINRERMYLCVVLRALVFCIPAFFFSFYAPYHWRAIYEFLIITTIPSQYALILLFAFIWFINMAIAMQLGIERITTYLNLHQRIWAWTKFICIFVFEALFFLSCNILLAELTPWWFPIVASLVFARVRYNLTKLQWLGRF